MVHHGPVSIAEPADAVGRGRRTSVRTILLAWIIGVTAVATVFSTGLGAVVQLAGVGDRIDAALRQEVEEFRQFAATGVDPETGDGFTSVTPLLRVALQRNVADPNETFLTLVDGEVIFVPNTERDLALEQDPAFVARVGELTPTDPVLLADAKVLDSTVRYAAVPVGVEGSAEQGVYVIGYDVGAERADVLALLRTFGLVDVVALLFVAVASFAVASQLLRPVRLLRETAQRISDTGLGERIPVNGRDELSELAHTFNAMLDRLEASFAGQRQFMDDAGHELRTPITILRGHLELLDPEDPADVAQTRALLLDELDRTSRLVEDLSLLAKARRPDFVAPSPVDLARLVRGAQEKARALGDRAWVLDEVTDRTALLDGQRIEQALLQLASNAVRFTRQGGTIGLGCRAEAGTVSLWVRDDGEGIAPEDHERVFQRFGRVETGRGEQGSGLGLAIVSAIAKASGGRVRLDSSRGAGARFTLELPWSSPHAHPHAPAKAGRTAEDRSLT